ncbi:MAG TPA: cob(I)yrinic acid a,c-diamide adenosyltransferase [Actinomycetota bacterium]
MRIYTKAGDDGTTGLLYGGRIPKSDPAAEAYGTVDEAVACLGLARANATDPAAHRLILEIQRDLFIVGADLATNPEERGKLKPGVSLTTSEMIERLEGTIDALVEVSPIPEHFVVPGASPGSAALDIARAVVRRAERRAVALREAGREVNPEAIRYLNRLSDLLFVLARSQAGGPEEPSRSEA